MEVGLLTLGDHRPNPVTGEWTTQAERHRDIKAQLDMAEPAGFDLAVVGEHHFSDFIVSVPQVFLAWLAGRTNRIRLATGVTLLPHHDPVRIAEDFNTLDVVSDGRAEIWIGKGVNPAVYAQYGQDTARINDYENEKLDLLIRLLTETDVHWSGEFRAPLTGVTLEPRPVQRPHWPIALTTSSAEGAARIGALGHRLTLTLLAFPRDQLGRICDLYRTAFVEAGHAGEPHITVNVHMQTSDTTADARAVLEAHQGPFQRWVFGKRFGVPADEVQLPPRILDFASPECAIVHGSPAEVLDRVGGIVDVTAADRFTVQADYGGRAWPLVERSIELFADLIPEIRSMTPRATTAVATGAAT